MAPTTRSIGSSGTSARCGGVNRPARRRVVRAHVPPGPTRTASIGSMPPGRDATEPVPLVVEAPAEAVAEPVACGEAGDAQCGAIVGSGDGSWGRLGRDVAGRRLGVSSVPRAPALAERLAGQRRIMRAMTDHARLARRGRPHPARRDRGGPVPRGAGAHAGARAADVRRADGGLPRRPRRAHERRVFQRRLRRDGRRARHRVLQPLRAPPAAVHRQGARRLPADAAA